MEVKTCFQLFSPLSSLFPLNTQEREAPTRKDKTTFLKTSTCTAEMFLRCNALSTSCMVGECQRQSPPRLEAKPACGIPCPEGSAHRCPTAVHMKLVSTSALKAFIWNDTQQRRTTTTTQRRQTSRRASTETELL